MLELLISIFPNLERTGSEFVKAIGQTLQMVGYSGAVAFVFGIVFGVILIVTKKQGIMENTFIYNIIDKTINIIRSIPFIILIVLLFPISRALVGTAIGVKGAIIPLIIGTVPFFSRQIETAIAEVDKGLIEAAQSMGVHPIREQSADESL